MRTPNRGRWGTFLLEQRQARGWTQEQAFAQLREGLGLGPNSRSSYVALERGERPDGPDPDQQRFLIEFYRAEPPESTEAAPPQSDVAAAIDRQTDVISEQTNVLNAILSALSERPALTAPGAELWAVELLRGRGWSVVEPGTELPHRGHGHADTPDTPPQPSGRGTASGAKRP